MTINTYLEAMQIQLDVIKCQLCNVFQCADYIGLKVSTESSQLGLLIQLVHSLQLSQMQK